jgi:hypothetical protein
VATCDGPSVAVAYSDVSSFQRRGSHALDGLDADGYGNAVSLDDWVDLGAEAAPRTAQRMVWRLKEMRSLAADQPRLGPVTRSRCITGGAQGRGHGNRESRVVPRSQYAMSTDTSPTYTWEALPGIAWNAGSSSSKSELPSHLSRRHEEGPLTAKPRRLSTNVDSLLLL